MTKAFFPTVAQRLKIKLQVSPELTTMITGHGKLRSYLNRFKIIDEPTCPCNDGEQTSDHLIFSCDNCETQRILLRNSILLRGGNWPVSKADLVNKYLKCFLKFVIEIDFDSL